MFEISDFTNDNFRVLAHLYDNMNEQHLIKITQQEVSEELCLSRITINKIFKQLKEKSYIMQDKTRVGRYYLLQNGVEIVELFRKTNLGGKAQ